MGRLFIRNGKLSASNSFVGKNLIAKFYMATSTFDIEVDNQSVQTWAESLRTKSNVDGTLRSVKFPIVIDGIWQNTHFNLQLQKTEKLNFVSIANDGIQKQTFNFDILSLNYGINNQDGSSVIMFYDNTKTQLNCGWHTNSVGTGTNQYQYFFKSDNSFTIPAVPGILNDSVMKATATVNNIYTQYYGLSNFSETTGAGGGMQFFKGETKATSIARSCAIMNNYIGAAAVKFGIKGNSKDIAILIGKGDL
jgi:hypothetical protein